MAALRAIQSPVREEKVLNNADLRRYATIAEVRRYRLSMAPDDRPSTPLYDVWRAVAKTVSGKQVVYIRRLNL